MAINWNDGLEGTALNIAGSEATPLRVVAGPGTGKTFALMRRVARLLQKGSEPESIFLCSFTRTAAADLTKAIGELLVEGADGVRTSTLHSYCFEVLARESVLAVTNRVPRPLLDLETRFLIEDIKCDLFGGVRECKKRLEAFNSAWARLQHQTPGWCDDATDKAFGQSLLGWLRFHRCMLIGEVVPELLRYFRLNPGCPDRGSFRHVLVDEYQDLNKAEQELLDLIAENASYSVIGDDDQSIYSFKHAHPEGIIGFPDRYTGTHNEQMNDCRRCPKRVVAMANALIVNNTVRSPRLLKPWPDNPDGEVHVVQWLSMADEARGVAKFIAQKIDAGEVAMGRVLVLSPRRHFGYAIRDELNRRGIAAHSFFTEELFDGDVTNKKECKAATAYAVLCLLANPDDVPALRVWSGLGAGDLRRPAWEALRAHCEGCTDTPRQALEQIEAGTLTLPIHKTTQGKLVERYKELKALLDAYRPLAGRDLFDTLFPDGDEALEPLRPLAPTIKTEWDAKKVFDAVSTFISQPEMPTDADYVRVMSLHKSKGLTADCVVVTGCVEGALPMIDPDLPIVEQDRLTEEQRRLMYVAITRTRQTLLLSSVLTVPKAIAFSMNMPNAGAKGPDVTTRTSRFIGEMGPTTPKAIMGNMLP